MFTFLHIYIPNPIFISLGPINIHWYGLFVALGSLSAIITSLKIASYYKIKKEVVIDLAFWLIVYGLLGARIYHVFLELPYYFKYPLDIFKIWHGGLAIHGGILAGVIVLYFYAKKYKINFWQLGAIVTPCLALGQAIGRWGNYFNQELFGQPTNLPWGIPIDIINRPFEYLNYEYFHPTFLYESIGNFLIFILLITLHILIIKKKIKPNYLLLTIGYLISYSLLRFGLEFIRIDTTPIIAGLRFPQWISLSIILLSTLIIFIEIKPRKKGLEINSQS